MYFVAGITGHVGGAAARALLARGERVRSFVRDPNEAADWKERGVDLRKGDLTDPDALTAALEDTEGAFLMQPTPMGVTRAFEKARALNASIGTALERIPPPRVAVLSSVGSDRLSGTGNILQTHLLEEALEGFEQPLAILRAGALLENNLPAFSRAGETGRFDSFLQPVNRAFPMVATADIGMLAGRLLAEGWQGRKIVEVGRHITPHQIARAMGETLGREVSAHAIPREAWPQVLQRMGLEGEEIENWEEMQDGFNSGHIDFGQPGTERFEAPTTPAAFFREALARIDG